MIQEVPHCPDCGRADAVTIQESPDYSYGCTNPFCGRAEILLEDIVDWPFMDMCSSMFDDERIEKAANNPMEFSDECECDWCQRGRPMP